MQPKAVKKKHSLFSLALWLAVVLSAPAGADTRVEGRVRLDSGASVPGARVMLFDLTDLQAAPLAATADAGGHFVLSLAGLATAQSAVPNGFDLGPNYPNPFNPSTIIPYTLPASTHVRLEVFNILGQRVATLVDGVHPAGFHTTRWDATDAAGQAVGSGVYLYRLSGGGAKITRSMLLIDGESRIASGGSGSTVPAGDARAGEDEERAPVYGLVVWAPGLVPHIEPAFRVEAGMAPLDLLVEAPGRIPPAKAASSGGILGDVDNTGDVDFFDALLVALYSLDPSVIMPNNGDISLGDVNADGQVNLADAFTIAAYLNDPFDPALPSGIGELVGPAASLSPDPSTVTFAADGAWHRFTVEAAEAVSVVANPAGTTPRLEITSRSIGSNFCPPEADDSVSRRNGQTLYLAGCAAGTATVELRRPSDGTVLNTYTFEVTGSPPDLVVQSVSVSDRSLTPGQSFTLRATVRNQGGGQSAATTLRYYRSSDRTISTRDTQVGTDPVGALGASRASAEWIRLTAPSRAGTYYYGACVVSVAGESNIGNNCTAGVRVRVEARSPDLVVGSVSVSESSLTPGQSFTLRATVRNQGGGQSAVTALRYYRSSDRTISTRDTRVGTDAIGALGASRASAESIRLTAPSSAGTYYYGACVVSVRDESNTRNNCSTGIRVTVDASSPDLVVETLLPVDAQTSGQSFQLLSRVRNQGTGRSAATTLRWYRSTRDTLVGTNPVGALAPSGTSEVLISLTAPSSVGHYYYYACVDSVSGESNTRNNCSLGGVVSFIPAPASNVWKLYWAEGGAIKIQRSNLDGSGVEDLITTGLAAPSSIALDVSGDKMYWTEPFGEKIRRSNLDGRGVEDLVTRVAALAIALDVSAGKMYWTEPERIRRSNLDGSRVENLVTTVLSPFGIALDVSAGKMYWTDDGRDRIQRSNLDGSRVENLVTTVSTPFGIALDVSAGKMYWTDGGRDRIQRSNLDGRGVEDLVTGLEAPFGIALDVSAGKMYWSDSDKIQRSNLDGRGVEDLVTGLVAPFGVAVGLVSVEAGTDTGGSSPVGGGNPELEFTAIDRTSVTLVVNGPRVRVNYTLTNTGDAPSEATSARLYVSRDSTISARDDLVGTYDVPALQPGGQATLIANLAATGPLQDFYVGYCVDAVPGEKNPANNCSDGVPVTTVSRGSGKPVAVSAEPWGNLEVSLGAKEPEREMIPPHKLSGSKRNP